MSHLTTEQATAAVVTRDSQPALRILFTSEGGGQLRPPFLLQRGTTSIGRVLPETGAGVVIDTDRQVSRLHATISVDEQGVRILDAGSRNGIQVNGNRVTESPLVDGDLIRLGNSFVVLRDEPLVHLDATIETLVGRAPSIRALRHAIAQVAPTRAMVLLLGESGTGKEVTARALHSLSGRKGPFVAVNCAAIPETLAESQLFGHTRGAFTGATPHSGYFRAAEGGTLFLDEVGELSATLQPKFLRALEEGSVLPVGATQPIPVDVRVVAATNRALGRSVADGAFRGDLLARLAEFSLELPPLRQRREDILPLLMRALGSPVPQLHPDLVERLLMHSWPFNVREVMKLGTELQIKGSGLSVLGADLVRGRFAMTAGEPPANVSESVGLAASKSQNTTSGEEPVNRATERSAKSFERAAIPSPEDLRALLVKHNGVVANIAREMNRSRTQVLRWLEQRGLSADDYRIP